MAVYEVIVLGVQGANNKVFGPGERVTEAHFPPGNAEKLVKEGKLRKVSTASEDTKAAKAAKVKKLQDLQDAIDAANKNLNAAKDALSNAPEDLIEEDKAVLVKAVEDAEIALNKAKTDFENA